MIKKRWVADNDKLTLIDELYKETGMNKTLLRILLNRDIKTKDEIEKFLNPKINDFFDPFLLKDMDKAVDRINKAIENKEKIAIYGDYDVDGVTASAILTLYLRERADIVNYIPKREGEGYGVNTDAILKLKSEGVTLIITVDCGITSVEEARYAKDLGIDLIVTDHHTCPDILPECLAVINPKRQDGNYPFSELCGAGVALKLVMALGEKNLDKYLAICAVGTVADIVPLISENRIIVSLGLLALRKNKLKQISCLSEIAGLSYENITSEDLGFVIGPRINAAGRMGSAFDALTLLLSEDDYEIAKKAEILNRKNLIRQETEQNIIKEAVNMAENELLKSNKDILVLWGENWHEGVIGIVSSKITDKYYKPSILLSLSEDMAKGSGRSIKGFNIYDALKSQEHNLVKFGGHELAAGLSLKKENLARFKEEIEEYAKEYMKDKKFLPELFLDSELTVDDMNEEFLKLLSLLEPFGMGNLRPVLLIKDARIIKVMAFKEGKHLRISIEKEGKTVEAVGFNMGNFSEYLSPGDEIYIAATLEINEFRGIRKFQLKIKDIKKKG